MKLLFLVILFVGALAIEEQEYLEKFSSWALEYGKKYDSNDELRHRFSVWKANFEKILDHNSKNLSWKMGLNEFTDLTLDEFRSMKMGGRLPTFTKPAFEPSEPTENVEVKHVKGLPESWDWRDFGAVTPVYNQNAPNYCTSCWSFSVGGAVESACFIKNHQMIPLSQQEIVDCAREYVTPDCNAHSLPSLPAIYKYVQDHSGLCAMKEYPYLAKVGENCWSRNCTAKYCAIKEFKQVPFMNEQALKEAVFQQPISIVADVSNWDPAFKGGLFDGKCGVEPAHAMLLVGYGVEQDSGKKYWIIKNSWGESWGEKGYIRLLREDSVGQPGKCALTFYAYYPVML